MWSIIDLEEIRDWVWEERIWRSERRGRRERLWFSGEEIRNWSFRILPQILGENVEGEREKKRGLD